jgi:hypothetical protein
VTLPRVLVLVSALAAPPGALSAQGQGPPPSPPEEATTLDVMTFNIRTATGRDGNDSWPFRKELVAGPRAR